MKITNEDATFLKSVLEEKLIGIENFNSHPFERRVELLKEIHVGVSTLEIANAVKALEVQNAEEIRQTTELLGRITAFYKLIWPLPATPVKLIPIPGIL